jgi:cysteinyl-tRNA synthetase
MNTSRFSAFMERFRRARPAAPVIILFTNTLTQKKEPFVPLQPGRALMYTCGPTVYGEQHIGNLRPGLTADLIARTLEGAQFRVKRVINITDVGHMVGDTEEGEDKIAMGAAREKRTPEEISAHYAKLFISDLGELNINTDAIDFPRATAYIKEQIALAKLLEEKGYAYRLKEGLYFDVSKFRGYGKLGGIASAKLEAGARVGLIKGKHNPADFVLWRAAKPNDLQQWESPWGSGNPGWHIECSAMSRSLLGPEIDIHTGGEDLAMIHHNDEIAQSEAASGRPFVHYWLHNAFLTMAGEKVSKSLGNVVYMRDVTEKGFHPLALRYLFLQAHYRTPLSFSWESLTAAQSALERLWNLTKEVATESDRKGRASEARRHFLAAMRDDLNTPQALAVLWEALKSEDYTEEEKWDLVEVADAHLGLSLTHPPEKVVLAGEAIPESVQRLLEAREAARARKDFAEADRLRAEITALGYALQDSPTGAVLTKTTL